MSELKIKIQGVWESVCDNDIRKKVNGEWIPITDGDYLKIAGIFEPITCSVEPGDPYYLSLSDVDNGGNSHTIYARLYNTIGEDVFVSEDIIFDWGAITTPVGGGTSSSIGNTGSLLIASATNVSVYNYDSSEETIDSKQTSNANPNNVDGHNIITGT